MRGKIVNHEPAKTVISLGDEPPQKKGATMKNCIKTARKKGN